MTSILKVSEIQDPTNSNTALTINATGDVKIPGHVVQFQKYQAASKGSGTLTSTSYVSDGEISITPKYSDSILAIVANSGASISSGYGYFRIFETASSTEVQKAPWGNFSSSPQWLASVNMSATYTPGDTTTRVFQLQGQVVSGTRYINYETYLSIMVYEIAQQE